MWKVKTKPIIIISHHFIPSFRMLEVKHQLRANC
jgi:hypothetical protein